MKKRSAKPRMKPKVPEVVYMKATPHGVTLIALSGNKNHLYYAAYRK